MPFDVKRFRGISPAALTMFDEETNLDEEATARHRDFPRWDAGENVERFAATVWMGILRARSASSSMIRKAGYRAGGNEKRPSRAYSSANPQLTDEMRGIVIRRGRWP
jgi:hypothetical protein